jgi:hypothetical protein
MASLLWRLFLLAVNISPSRATIAAWWNELGPQVILQDEATGDIRYSACNAYEQAWYSTNGENSLKLSHKPKNGTPLAGVGWYTQAYTVYVTTCPPGNAFCPGREPRLADRQARASIWYITEFDEIANTVVNCNNRTGLFRSVGNWVVSRDAPSIHSNSGLAAIVLGESDGYRVYYHDKDGAINELKYDPKRDEWSHNGFITKDISSLPALAATFTSKENITVVAPRDDKTIGVTRYQKNGDWQRSMSATC